MWRASGTPHPLPGRFRLEAQVREQVEIFKYLDTEIDHNLSFRQHADGDYKKVRIQVSPEETKIF